MTINSTKKLVEIRSNTGSYEEPSCVNGCSHNVSSYNANSSKGTGPQTGRSEERVPDGTAKSVYSSKRCLLQF